MHDAKFRHGSDDTVWHREDGSQVPSDEPLFTIRGKNEVGAFAIAEYVRVMESYAAKSPLARDHAEQETS